MQKSIIIFEIEILCLGIHITKFLHQWDKKIVYHSYFVIETLQQVIDDENNNKDRQQPKIH